MGFTSVGRRTEEPASVVARFCNRSSSTEKREQTAVCEFFKQTRPAAALCCEESGNEPVWLIKA
jgi:hypothetical protein